MIEAARSVWIARALGVGAAAVPLAGWFWPTDAVVIAVLGRAIGFAAALHGLGRVVAELAGDDDEAAPVAMAWGVAAFIAASGVLLALGWNGPAGRTALAVAGILFGAGWCYRHPARVVGAFDRRRRARAIAAVLAIAAIGAFAVLAAAGHARGLADGDAHYAGQIRRLADTGALADGIGFPRASGLGGQLAVAAIVDTIDPRMAHLADRGVLWVLAVVLAAAMARRAERSGIMAVLVGALVLAVPALPDDAGPRWSLVVLALATVPALDLARRSDDRRAIVPAALVIGALCTVRHAGLGFALVALGSISPGGRDRRGLAAALAAAVVAPYAVSALRAGAALIDVHGYAWIAAGTGAGLALLALLAIPRSTERTVALGLCLTAACAGALTASRADTTGVLIAAGIAVVLLALAASLRPPFELGVPGAPDYRPPPHLAAPIIAVTLLAGALALARFPAGRLAPWPARLGASIDDLRALGSQPLGPRSRRAADYARAQAAVPAGASVDLNVDRPDLIDYAAHAVVDRGRTAVTARSYLLATVPAPGRTTVMSVSGVTAYAPAR